MKPVRLLPNRFFAGCMLLVLGLAARGQAFKQDVAPLVESSCIDCHDADTDTQLNFESLKHDLANPDTFRQWVKIFDRVQKGEMPPKKKKRPDKELKNKALAALEKDLRTENLKQQRGNGRVLARRLTRLEYEFTLHDLLGIRGELAKHLPPENASSTFDTVAADQGLSPVHIHAYLDTADLALDEAIKLGPSPLRHGGQTRKIDGDAVVIFNKQGFTTRSDAFIFRLRNPGMYRVTAQAHSQQAATPVTLVITRASDKQERSELVGAFDLHPQQSRRIELTTYLTPDHFFHLAVTDLDWQADGKHIFATQNAKANNGEEIDIKWLKVEGPIEKQWPPKRTRDLLTGARFKRMISGSYTIQLSKAPLRHVADVVERLAPLALRRPLDKRQIEPLVHLAKPFLKEGHGFDQAVRVSLRAMLSSPQFLFHSGEPGALDDHALAERLSYFLWKSLPDEELFRLAQEKKLSQPEVLTAQVNRMLDDPKSNRFSNDFLNGWLGLRDIDATIPDGKLYPEYNDFLGQSMISETRQFFRELIDRNLSTSNFIDSDFTFLNRRLATHYGISGIIGEHMRRVTLPPNSVRGGLMTHASILKVTANGTFTSPVKRGNFVLSALLGTPPTPPPPDIGTIEPDTRGTTTIRETLAKHRNVEKCATCHRHIDPPGFALESFDPIGRYRTRYRITGDDSPQQPRQGARPVQAQYREGPRVDSSGTTHDGKPFDGIREFKEHLLTQEEQVARHFISLLAIYATGSGIQFADRDEIERIVRETKPAAFPARAIIHQIVQSKLFRNK